MQQKDCMVVVTTCSSKAEARTIATTLVDERLIACANIFFSVLSIYRWQDKLCEDNEVFMVMKSRQDHLDRIIERIKSLHSYEVPEIIALPILSGSESYLDWVRHETNEQT
jgi:periplasmic divalent cation tolerance protein